MSQEFISKRATKMPPLLAMEVHEKASQLKREGRSIIHLELGETDFGTPPAAIEAGIKG